MKEHILEDFKQLKVMLSSLKPFEFIRQFREINEGSIGKHMRHILEFYEALLLHENEGQICYDNRHRDIQLETDMTEVNILINRLIEILEKNYEDKSLQLVEMSQNPGQVNIMETTFNRELLYCLEHSIHHQALIRVCLFLMDIPISENLGVAPSTRQFKMRNYTNEA